MFWPDVALLSRQSWWTEPAWDNGPGYGQLVEALRPALRAALLLGWQVDSIEVGTGRATDQSTEWASIELATLELEPAKPLDVNKPFSGPNVHLGAIEVTDLLGRINRESPEILDGTFAIPIDIPVFGSDDLSDDETVPAGIVDGVESFVNDALDELVPTVPTVPANPDDPLSVSPPPRAMQQGLLWMLNSMYWRGLNREAERALDGETLALHSDPTAFLLDALHGQPVQKRHEEFWPTLAASVQAQGQAHRLPQEVRDRLPGMAWFDALSELIWRGAVLVDGLIEPPDPPEAIEAVPTDKGFDEPVKELTLLVWGGEAEITLRRELVFDDEGVDTVDTSVTWDYVPGDEQQRPTVVVVAGRGVAVEYDPDEVVLTGRTVVPEEDAGGAETARVGGNDNLDDLDRVPVLAWDLLIHRVQDDNLVRQLGAQIDPVQLLNPILVPADPVVPPIVGRASALLVVPKHDGVLLQFPAVGTNLPTNTPVSGVDIPCVVELTIEDPASGTTAWTADVYFYAYFWGSYWLGGAHLCVWATEGVQVHTNRSPGSGGRGDPSELSERRWDSAWLYSAELWEADKGAKLPRPFSVVLPYTESTAERADLLPGEPVLDYEGGEAKHDGITLIPAWHAYRQYGYRTSLGFLVFDMILALTPFGDVADIGEAVWAWQTGRDKWGRPVTDFEVALLIVCAAVPFVSSGLVRGIRALLDVPVGAIPTTELGRLAVPARWGDDLPLDQVEALRAIERMTQAPDGLASDGRRAEAMAAIRALANDTPIRTFGERLADGRATGWPTVGDIISQGGDGFSVGPVQTPFLRHLRDHPDTTLTPAQFVEGLIRGTL